MRRDEREEFRRLQRLVREKVDRIGELESALREAMANLAKEGEIARAWQEGKEGAQARIKELEAELAAWEGKHPGDPPPMAVQIKMLLRRNQELEAAARRVDKAFRPGAVSPGEQAAALQELRQARQGGRDED